MRFISVRELRENTAEVWKRLESDEIVVTSNGRPMAVLAHADEAQVEALVREIRLARMRLALGRIQKAAASSGASELDDDAIEAEIRAVRADRR